MKKLIINGYLPYPGMVVPEVYISNPSDYSEITVSTMLGQVVQQINNPTASNKLNISANARGIYIVKVSGQKNVYISKIIYE